VVGTNGKADNIRLSRNNSAQAAADKTDQGLSIGKPLFTMPTAEPVYLFTDL